MEGKQASTNKPTPQKESIMSNIITKIVNVATNETIVLDTTVSKAEQFRQVTTQGAAIGRTSFIYLLQGKQEVACGWKLVHEEEQLVEEVKTAGHRRAETAARIEKFKTEGEFADIIADLESKGFSVVKVKKTERQVALAVPGEAPTRTAAQFKINILKTGGYSVRFAEGRKATGHNVKLEEGATVADITSAVNTILSEVKA